MLPPPTDPGFPAALKAAREAAGLNLTQFAHRAQVNPVMPGRYESGATRPTHKTWLYLCAALGFGPAPVSPAQPAPVSPLPETLPQSVRDAVAHLTAFGATVTLSFPPGWRSP